MKLNFKKSLFLLSILFIILISISLVSAEDVSLADSIGDLDSLAEVDYSQEISSNDDSLSSEDMSNLEEKDNENTIEITDSSLSEEILESDSKDDSDVISNINTESKNKQKNMLSSSGDSYYNVYVDSVTARYNSGKYLYFGWQGYFSGYFKVFDSDWYCVHSEYVYGYDKGFKWSLDGLDADTYTAGLVSSDNYWVEYGTIKITKSSSKISVSKYRTKGIIYFYAYVKDYYNGDYYDGGKVKFRIRGKNYYATLKDGVATLKFKVPKKTKKYTCKATFLGGSNVYSSSKTFKFKVKKHKYYVYKAKKKYKVFKLGHNINGVELDYYARHGWKLVRYWTSSERHYSWMLGYWYMVYGKFKKTYWVKKAKYAYY